MAFTVKATAIVPKPLNEGKIRSEIAKVLMEEGKNDRAQFNKTVSGWSGEMPAMIYKVEIKAGSASVWIGPSGPQSSVDKWTRIDEGWEGGYTIAARNAPYLRFRWQGPKKSYNAKTTPGKFSSSGPGQKLGPVRSMKQVTHPGIYEPRGWSRTLGQQRIGPFAANIQAAIARGLA
jgi:hypothetical protein